MVVANDTANLGETIAWPGSGATGGTGSCRLDGNAYSPSELRGSLTAGLLSVSLVNLYSSSVSIVLDGVTGPGTFALGSGANEGDYYVNTPNWLWSTAHGGSGTATITRFDASARLVSGTFSFTANARPGHSGSTTPVVVTNGTFTDVPF